MPEGHTIHRAARLQNQRFAGRTVRLRSPQGRFDEGAALLDGQTVRRVEAHGKHLFTQFESGDVLHVHLGLFGKFRIRTRPFPEPSPNARLLLWTDQAELHLAGPTVCEVITDDEKLQIQARLGPDPLQGRPDGAAELEARLARRTIPIGAAILDQKVIAGLGNVYRAELLFLIGLHPFTVSREVPPRFLSELWDLAVTELTLGERAGRIVTVDPSEVGKATRAELHRTERLYCYKRHGQTCRRCDDEIVSADLDGRTIWWCPTHQPALG